MGHLYLRGPPLLFLLLSGLSLLDGFFPLMYTNIKHLIERGVEDLDTNRMKKTAEWFYSQIFRDEAIRPREPQTAEKVPSLIRTARSLENNAGGWQSREAIFYKQAKLLANYEEDYPFSDSVVRYFPTYQALTDRELRGYLSWRGKVRRGQVERTALSFAFLYLYELINQIGVESPLEGYRKLLSFQKSYGSLDESILPYLKRWLTDYVVYYHLDPALLGDSPQVRFDRNVIILENMEHQADEKVLYALKELAPKWLGRSKFYGQYPEDCNKVILRSLRRISKHYDTRCKKGFVEQFFGRVHVYPVQIFESAVFCDPFKIKNTEYVLDERYIYRCKNGLWTLEKYACPPRPNGKLEDLLKSLDAVMRQEYGYKNQIKCTLETKWILKIFREETQALRAEKKAAEEKKITIDFSQLSRIRQDAAITREKLTVEEEWENLPLEEPTPPEAPETPQPEAEAPDTPLDPVEYRLLQCLLYGRDTRWVQQEGHLMSVLVDSINEKLYDTFFDSVLEDTPALVEDYIDDLKEMVKP